MLGPEKGIWICRPNMANHAWDLATYQLAAAEIVDVSQSVRPEPRKEKKDRQPTAVNRAKSSWLGGIDTSGWMRTGL